MREARPKAKGRARNRHRTTPRQSFVIDTNKPLLPSLTQPLPLLMFQLNPPVLSQPAPPIQQSAGNFLEEVIRLAGQIGWIAYKAKWKQVSPDSRKVWDAGVELTTSPSVTPFGQEVGAVLCAASFLFGLDDIDKASDN